MYNNSVEFAVVYYRYFILNVHQIHIKMEII